MTLQDVQKARGPLTFIFWGSIILLIDIQISTVRGSGWGVNVDIVNDVVGMILITLGVSRLSTFELDAPYGRLMRFAMIMAGIGTIQSALDIMVFPWPAPLLFVSNIAGLLQILAIVGFCWAMRQFAFTVGLERSYKSWKGTTLLFAIIYAVPMGGFYAASAGAIAFQTSFDLNLGAAGVLLLPVFFAPVIHFLISTKRMLKEAEDAKSIEHLPPEPLRHQPPPAR